MSPFATSSYIMSLVLEVLPTSNNMHYAATYYVLTLMHPPSTLITIWWNPCLCRTSMYQDFQDLWNVYTTTVCSKIEKCPTFDDCNCLEIRRQTTLYIVYKRLKITIKITGPYFCQLILRWTQIQSETIWLSIFFAKICPVSASQH